MIETTTYEIMNDKIKGLVDTSKKASDKGNFLEATNWLSFARNEYESLICKTDNSNDFVDLKDYILEGHRYNKMNRSLIK